MLCRVWIGPRPNWEQNDTHRAQGKTVLNKSPQEHRRGFQKALGVLGPNAMTQRPVSVRNLLQMAPDEGIGNRCAVIEARTRCAVVQAREGGAL